MAGLEYALAVALAYLVGTFPSAYIVTRVATGGDIRRMGTGNVGVMNTLANVGWPAAALVFLSEAAKGMVAVMMGRYITGTQAGGVSAALAAVAGVNWSLWLRFRGGRGTTTGLTAALLISVPVLVGMAVVWVLAYLVLRNSFYATRINILALPVTAGVLEHSIVIGALAGVGSLMLLIRHKKETDDHLLLTQSSTVAYERAAVRRD